MSVEVDWEITDSPSSGGIGGFLSSLPVIGGLFGAGEQLVAVLAHFGLIIRWFFTFLFELSLNLLSMLFDVVSFGFGTLVWLGTTYTDVVSGAGGWASVILLVPGILFSVVFAKLVMVAISLLPTT
jgi:hypothetical protein